jgi:hypothetical protein
VLPGTHSVMTQTLAPVRSGRRSEPHGRARGTRAFSRVLRRDLTPVSRRVPAEELRWLHPRLTRAASAPSVATTAPSRASRSHSTPPAAPPQGSWRALTSTTVFSVPARFHVAPSRPGIPRPGPLPAFHST